MTTQAVWALGTCLVVHATGLLEEEKSFLRPLHILLASALAGSYGHYIHDLSRYRILGKVTRSSPYLSDSSLYDGVLRCCAVCGGPPLITCRANAGSKSSKLTTQNVTR